MNEKNFLTEIEEEKISSDHQLSTGFSRDTMRRIVICSFVTMCALPVLFCLYLVVRMNGVEKRLDNLSSQFNMKAKLEEVVEYTEATTEVSGGDMLVLEQDAYNDLGKGDLQDGNPVTMADNSVVTVEPASGKFVAKEQQKVYLTFDDGPSIYTDEILDILKENDVKATFFVVYTDDKSLWPMYKRIVDEGHTLAMHSYSHVYKEIYASDEAFRQDVALIHDFLYEQTGVDCTYYRFPGGSSNQVSGVDIQDLIGYLYTDGITYYDWNALSEDAVDVSLTPEELNENVMESVRTNEKDSIVLLHDLKNNPATMESLQALIDTLKSEGYEICPIDEDTKPVQHISYHED